MKNEISQILKLIEIGNLDKALQEAKILYKRDNTNLDIVKLLAYTYTQLGIFERVIEVLEKGFKSKPDKQDFDYFNNIGYAFAEIEEYGKSIPYLEKAISLNSNHPGASTILADVFLKKRNFDKANSYINSAMDIVNKVGSKSYIKYSNIFLLKSEINSAIKKDNETIESFLYLIKKDFNENIFFLLTNIDTKSINKELLNLSEERLKENINKYKNKIDKFNYIIPLMFGLAKCYEKIDKVKSETFYKNANDEIFKSSRYNSHQYQQRILKSIDIYEDKYKSENIESAHGDNNFFIVGSPRSGTTLVESIVTANEQVFPGGELKSAKSLMEKFILSNKRNIAGFRHEFLSKYIRRSSYLRGNFDYIVDKMPENFLYIGFISKLLPKSKLIRVFRDPWDTAVSLYKQRYILNVPYSVSFFNIGIFMANFEAINLYWDANIQDKRNILDIKYEEIVENFEIEQTKIYDFLCLESKYNEKKRNSFFSPTASIRQVNKDVHKKSLNKTEFSNKKDEFIDAFNMQRQFWKSKNIKIGKDFFGYKL